MQQDKPKVVKQIITSAKKHNIDLGKVTKINSNKSRITETPSFQAIPVN
jgi:hypothetical protein